MIFRSAVQYIRSLFNLEKNTGSIKRQYPAFILAGVISFILGVILLKIFYKEMELSLITSNSLSFVLVSGFNYYLSVKFVFARGRKSFKTELILFYITAALSLLLDNLFLYLLVNKANMYYIFAKTGSVFLASFFSFILRKTVVFKK